MNIIPVIDLKDGQVVLAKQGNRQFYQPIHSALCPSSDINAVLEAFLGLYHFSTFYIADLNAITGQGHHDRLIADLVARYSDIDFLVDKGYQRYSEYRANYYPVLGSECYNDEALLLIEQFNKQFVLSLDYSAAGGLGSARLFNESDLWPRDIIIMSLSRVGSFQGPDIIQLTQFCRRYPEKNFIAAGGVRDLADLLQLKAIGIKQVLVASALHSGLINGAMLEQLSSE